MNTDRRRVLLGALAATVSTVARGQTPPPASGEALPPGLPQPAETIDLWPDGAPGMPDPPPVETVVERSDDPQLNDRAVHGISVPRLAVFRPRVPNGAAILLAPGGAYRHVVVDNTLEFRAALVARGIPVETHLFTHGGHGFGLRRAAGKPAERWPQLFLAWSKTMRL